MDGEYDIFGNLVSPAAETNASPPGVTPEATSYAVVEAVSFSIGDAVEVKEGGKVYRAATVIKCELGIGSLDLQYADGEKECGVPVNLVRQPKSSPPGLQQSEPSTGSGGQQLQPPGMALETAPEAQANVTAAPNPTRSRRSKKESSGNSSSNTKEVPKARQCYELVKSFTEDEQEAALQMLLALDRVRKGV